ncbi:hypothetical protein NHH03_26585 [Stieleria sp. TO1_6]|uniref:hypothetical protein n=1 Tax=Stieleria tagensis TaxID=2956795 RepID=UPI00209B6040|nr:hypothetical protein [Stieleria tagensis]MCO8125334.1 hypothetical protein [Stieleria tagensis]
MNLRIAALILLPCCVTGQAIAQGRTVSRLFWQDNATQTVHYGDLKKQKDGWRIEVCDLPGHPTIDPDEQSLVQMQTADQMIVVGVRDHSEGDFGSGWFAIDSGLQEESHGDHSHWRYSSQPVVTAQLIDEHQGNPAHVYRYGESFVLANDAKNGFTVIPADRLRGLENPGQAGMFLSGGKGHITLALVENRVAYATYIDSEGDDKGRVDVVGLGDRVGHGYSIQCPTGTLHGATVNCGKVFLAPADGICWVRADVNLAQDPDSVQVHHLSLGSDENGKSLRTGALTCCVDHVLFTAGKGQHSKLCLLNAASDQPSVTQIAIPVEETHKLMSPLPVTTATGKRLAVMFSESVDDASSDQLWVADLDPDGDGDFSDAQIAAPIDVGPSQIVGHAGHHSAASLAGGRQLVISNPGDSSIWVLSLTDFSVLAKLSVEGNPIRLLALGN